MKKYESIAYVLLEEIRSGTLDEMPSLRKTMQRFSVSKTTAEHAYAWLEQKAVIESQPQKGWTILARPVLPDFSPSQTSDWIRYDFRQDRIDASLFESDVWRRCLRHVLESDALESYGNPLGEMALRQSLSRHLWQTRSIAAAPENIIVGPSFQSLLSILCMALPTRTVAIERDKGKEARAVFQRFGWPVVDLEALENGPLLPADVECLYVSSADMGWGHVPAKEVLPGLSEKTLLLEDGYNRELSYGHAWAPALVCRFPGIYFASFSRLLLPGLRLACMVVDEDVRKRLEGMVLSPNASKLEQLALDEYLRSDGMKRQLRRLSRIYKSRMEIMRSYFPQGRLEEAYLSWRIPMEADEDAFICACEKRGIGTETFCQGGLSLCFAQLSGQELEDGCQQVLAALMEAQKSPH